MVAVVTALQMVWDTPVELSWEKQLDVCTYLPLGVVWLLDSQYGYIPFKKNWFNNCTTISISISGYHIDKNTYRVL
jgi:hypothetical protein